MTITPTSSTTDNAAMMGQSFTNVAGTGGSGTGALFNVTVGEMTTTPTSSTTSNTSMMGQTFTNVAASAPAGGGTTAKYTVTVGQMQFNETSGNSTSDAELFSTNYANISATTVTGGGSGAIFDVSINGSGSIEASVTQPWLWVQCRRSAENFRVINWWGLRSHFNDWRGKREYKPNRCRQWICQGEAINILGNLIGGTLLGLMILR